MESRDETWEREEESSEMKRGGTGQRGGTAEEVRLTSGKLRGSSSEKEVDVCEGEEGRVVREGKVEKEVEGGARGGGERRRRRERESNVRQQQ